MKKMLKKVLKEFICVLITITIILNPALPSGLSFSFAIGDKNAEYDNEYNIEYDNEYYDKNDNNYDNDDVYYGPSEPIPEPSVIDTDATQIIDNSDDMQPIIISDAAPSRDIKDDGGGVNGVSGGSDWSNNDDATAFLDIAGIDAIEQQITAAATQNEELIDFPAGYAAGYSITELANSSKVIIILPGYLGSELYVGETKLWLDAGLILSILSPFGSSMSQDSSGNGMRADVNPSLDDYGTIDTYEKLVVFFQKKYDARYGGNGDYDVVFFPYNWLGDLNYSAQLLDEYVTSKGYDKIVIITHSTGGLLAADYIARIEDKQKIEKALLIAAPLYGTFASLEPIEFGTNSEIQGWFDILNKLSGSTITSLEIKFKQFVRDITKNSPNTYQLLPSSEYLQNYPIEKITWDLVKLRAVSTRTSYTTAEGMYSILNDKKYTKNINTNLTNGSEKSHMYFRETVLNGNMIDVLREVPTVLIGNKSGFLTPIRAMYTNWAIKDFDLDGSKLDIVYDYDGDGTISGYSSSLSYSGLFHYEQFDGNRHVDLVKNDSVLEYLANEIENIPAGAQGGGIAGFGVLDHADLQPVSRSMSDMVKINISADEYVDINIYSGDERIAAITQDESFGFDGDEFIYRSTAADLSTSSSLIYMPNDGYQVSFTNASGADDINLNVIVAPLDDDGSRIGVGAYNACKSDESGHILTLDMSSGVTMDNVDALDIGSAGGLSVAAEAFNVDWTLDADQINFNGIGETAYINVIGNTEAEALEWQSSDESVITVYDGLVTATGYGQASVYAFPQDISGKVERVYVKVSLEAATVAIGDISIAEGERKVIKPVFYPADATETGMVYTYDTEKNIIAIDNGLLIGLNAGIIEVTGVAPGGASAVFIVTVTDTGAVDQDGESMAKTGKAAFGSAVIEPASPETTTPGTIQLKTAAPETTMSGRTTSGTTSSVSTSINPTPPAQVTSATSPAIQDETVPAQTSPPAADIPVTVWNNPYIDVFDTDWFFEAVQFAAENGLMHGFGDAFTPDEDLTRAMFVTALWRLEGEPGAEGIFTGFPDTEQGAWYEKAVGWAARNGIVIGYPDGLFRPDNPVTREEAMTILYRYTSLKKQNIDASADLQIFTDMDEISAWSLDAMKWAASAGIIQGRLGSNAAPRETCTRAETALIFKRFIGL